MPPFKLQLHTGAEITEVLKNAEEIIEGFTTKLKVKYDDEDLEGLMATAQCEKLTSSQVPEIVQEKMITDAEGNVEKNKFIVSLFLVICIIIYFIG